MLLFCWLRCAIAVVLFWFACFAYELCFAISFTISFSTAIRKLVGIVTYRPLNAFNVYIIYIDLFAAFFFVCCLTLLCVRRHSRPVARMRLFVSVCELFFRCSVFVVVVVKFSCRFLLYASSIVYCVFY